MRKCYVYLLIDSSTGQPFYVGKGNGDRMFKHKQDALSVSKTTHQYLHNKPHHVHIRNMVAQNIDIIYEKCLENVSDQQALKEEKHVIQRIGRKIIGTGPLLNISRGGTTGGETCKPVSQYLIDGTIIATFPSVKVASETVIGANHSYIIQCCKKKRKSAGGFLWTYEGDATPIYTHEYHRSVCQYSSIGKLLSTYRSLTDAATVVGVNVRTISKACTGMSKSSAGFFWRYATEPFELGNLKIHLANRSVQQFTLQQELLRTFNSINDAARSVRVSGTRIKQVCDNKYGAKTAGGYIWKYA